MRKKSSRISIAFLLLAVCSAKYSAAQEDTTSYKQMRKGFIGFALGPSFPSRVKSNLYSSDRWTRGLALDLVDFGYYFNRKVAVAVKYEGAAYPLYSDYPLFTIGSAFPYTIKSYDWDYGTLLAGLRLSSPKQKVTESIGVFIGLLTAESPTIVLSSDSTGYGPKKEIKGKSATLAIDADLGLNYHLSKRFDLLVRVSFLYAKPKYEFEASSGQNWYYANSFTQKINNLKTLFGLAYRLK